MADYTVVIEADNEVWDRTSFSTVKNYADMSVSGDYARLSPLKRLEDVGVGFDVKSLGVSSCFRETVLGLERFAKLVLSRFGDLTRGLDYVAKGKVLPVWDYPYVHEYMFKLVSRCMPILDGVIVSDWLVRLVDKVLGELGFWVDVVSRAIDKVYVDLARVADRLLIVGLVIVELMDWFVGEHVTVKDIMSVKRDTGAEREAKSFDVVRNFRDAGLGVDFVGFSTLKPLEDSFMGMDVVFRDLVKVCLDYGVFLDWKMKYVGKSVLDWCVGVDWIVFPWMKYVYLWDYLVGEHVPVKSVVKVGVDWGLAYDWVGFVKFLVVQLSDVGVWRDFIPKVLSLFDRIDSLLEFSTVRGKVLQDKALVNELVWKFGYTLMGLQVWRRVYHRVWFDLIEVEDQNVKVDVCKAVIDAFWSVWRKLQG
ncbi:MAG: hypothetical protein QXJ07_04440 [Candidatus Bathyarchaeia archaeon]